MAQFDFGSTDIGQFAGVDVIKMVVRFGRRVVDEAARIYSNFAGNAMAREQVKRVVNGRFRNPTAMLTQVTEDLVGGHMCRERQQQHPDLHSLGRWFNAIIAQPRLYRCFEIR